MTAVIRAPRINTNDDQVGVVAWHVQDGDYIEVGDSLVDLETSKAVTTLECEAAGYVRRIARQGDIIKVGEPICQVSDSVMDAHAQGPEPQLPGPPGAGSPMAEPETAPPKPMPVMADAGAPTPTPRPVGGVKAAYPATRFSPAAAALMQQLGLQASAFEGAGLVTARSIREAGRPKAAGNAAARPAATAIAAPAATIGAAAAERPLAPREATTPLSKRAEIETLTLGESGLINSTITVYFNSAGVRRRLAQSRALDGNIQPVILYELSRLLRQWPQFTAYFDDNAIHYYDRVDLGVAIDLGKGLKVVTLKGADQLLPVEIFEKTLAFGLQYMENRLQPSDLAGSTLTVTDLSGFDVLHFKPLINGRQSAILGLGGDSEAPGHPMTFNLTFDHRVSNGREAASFLKELRSRVLSYADPAPSVGAPAATPLAQAPAARMASAAPGPLRCSRCGIDHAAYSQEFGRDAHMMAAMTPAGTLEAVCHRCSGGWL